MASTKPTTFRIDPELREKAEPIFAELGLTPSAAINLFYRATIRANGLPFDLTLGPAKRPAESDFEQAVMELLARNGFRPDAEDHELEEQAD